MSNMFKNNSRFSVLSETEPTNKPPQKKINKRFEMDDNDNDNESNSFKSNQPEKYNKYNAENNDTRHRHYDNYSKYGPKKNKFNYDPKKEEEKLQKIKEEKKLKDLDINNFPETMSSTQDTKKKQSVVIDKPSFIEKIKIEKVDKTVAIKEEVVRPGWVSISLKNRKPEHNYGFSTYISDEVKNSYPEKVMQNLVTLHETRKTEYINTWGYEDYEKTFMFTNYDYYYFDELDEKYEEKMNELSMLVETDEYQEENDYY